MKLILILPVFLFLTACGGSGPTLSEAQMKGAEYRVAADSFLSNTLGVDGCPAGTRPVSTDVDTSTAASISIENGAVNYGAYSAGNRSNECK